MSESKTGNKVCDFIADMACNLAEGLEADAALLLINKDGHWGVFVGGESKMKDDAQIVASHLRGAVKQLQQMVDGIDQGDLVPGKDIVYHFDQELKKIVPYPKKEDGTSFSE